ncbi:MAG: CatB-related O-acetyltransferase [Bacteroidota bacterium]
MINFIKLYKLKRKYPLCKIESWNISPDVVFGIDVHIKPFVDIGTGVKIGAYSYINSYTELKDASIGAFCSIAGFCSIGMDSHPINWLSTSPKLYSKLKFNVEQCYKEQKSGPIIGNDVWIGSHSIIMRGVEIGDGAIIGAGAIVTKNVPPFAIVAGCPAKVINYRFNQDVIEKIQNLKWWDMDDQSLLLLKKDILLKEGFYKFW